LRLFHEPPQLPGFLAGRHNRGTFARSQEKSKRILLRSSWQNVNIGDIAHTPGMLALLEKHRPNDTVRFRCGIGVSSCIL